MQLDLFSEGGGDGGGSHEDAVALHEVTRSRYLNYALSVITSRALPDVRDGLKPVQRRILFAMYRDLKLRADSRFLKSARVVGDVMGKYHPHGDQSIYDAMVRMAQSFSLRYPLVDGHGNFGSLDGDSAAAMRYTEARLRPLADELLSELNQNTVDERPNYDGQLQEPIVLPAQIPNLLINGASGIAVGMATNIPPHNLGEVIDGLVAMIDHPDLSLTEACALIQAPDFPTGGEILNTPEELEALYETGQGPVKLRGTYVEETINRKRCIVIDSIPYGLNKSTLVEKIAQLVAGKAVPQLVDVRDESTEEVRIVLELRRGAEPNVAMAYLYKHTPLQQNFNLNLTCLVPTENPEVSRPERLGLLAVLRYFLDFRMEVVTRRLNHELGQLRRSIHRLEGFEIVFDALDEIIALIRASEGKADAARQMMARFPLDAEQTEAILELKLYRLAKLEILLIREQLAEQRARAAELERLLADDGARWSLVRTELLEIRDAYIDPRRTRIVGPEVVPDFDPEAYIVKEKTFVIVTRQGRVKRQKGFSELAAIRVPEGDAVAFVLRTDTTHTVTFYTQFGQAYTLRIDDIGATTGYGDPVQARFSFADGERIIGVSCSDSRLYPEPTAEELAALAEDDPRPPYGVTVTRLGKITRFPLGAFHEVSTRGGRKFVSLAEGDEAVAVYPSVGDENVCLASESGRVILFALSEVPAKGSAVRGVNALRLDEKDRVLGFALARKKREGLVTWTSRGRELVVRETSYQPVKRGGKGTEVIRLGSLVRWDRPVEIYDPGAGDDDEVPPEAP
ncbi:MAG: DNA topoisomerase IV subunit A [Myxococcales bacterium]|nr:DNA topoisomerase IV subunit A [Myxococcales bacterium]